MRVKSDSKVGTDTQSAVLVEIFRKQLDIKDHQIAAQNDVIKGLSERLREGNILMGTLQQQLSPPDTATRDTSAVVDADAPTPNRRNGLMILQRCSAHSSFRRICVTMADCKRLIWIGTVYDNDSHHPVRACCCGFAIHEITMPGWNSCRSTNP